MSMERDTKHTANYYGKIRAFYSGLGVDGSLVNQFLPANAYATATRAEIAAQELLLVQELRNVFS